MALIESDQMAWTNKQKAIAVQSCRAARLSDEHRKLLLCQFHNARFDAKGERTDASSSTSKRLTNADFEAFMAVIERTNDGRLPGFSAGYWSKKSGDRLHRLRWAVHALADRLEAEGLLASGGIGLAGWIQKRVTQGEPREVAHLDYHELLVLITQLNAHARQNKRTEAA